MKIICIFSDKPRNATLTVDRSPVCQNDPVTLTCTSGPSNPAPSSYKFYHNDALVQNTSSNTFNTKATTGLPDVNRFTCAPSNLLGDAENNATTDVSAKGINTNEQLCNDATTTKSKQFKQCVCLH